MGISELLWTRLINWQQCVYLCVELISANSSDMVCIPSRFEGCMFSKTYFYSQEVWGHTCPFPTHLMQFISPIASSPSYPLGPFFKCDWEELHLPITKISRSQLQSLLTVLWRAIQSEFLQALQMCWKSYLWLYRALS